MDFDAVLLSRVQFAVTVAFHILFPTLTIGLALFLVIIEGLWLRTREAIYYHLYKFWVKIFALSFGMGVVSGVVLSYQFGTNFSAFSDAVGNVIGPLLGYEVMTAFFLEASFLGIMLFGWNRVSPRLHFASTCIVALGTAISAFWILAAVSWMHTPTGHRIEDGIFYVESWREVIFNPSFAPRFAHMMLATYLTTAFVVAGVSAYYLLRRSHQAMAKRTFSMALVAALVLAPLQILVGDVHGLQVQRDQPMKVAAMEGVWETRGAVPFLILAIPDQAAAANRFEIGIPYAASLVLKHDPHGEILGLDQVEAADRPYVPLVFYSFRIMLAIGMLMLAAAVIGWWLRRRGRLYDTSWFLRLCLWMTPTGFIATVAGWVVTETGRQPWIVHGLMRTADGVSPVPAQAVLTSLSLFIAVYGVLFLAFLYYIITLIRRGPSYEQAPPEFRPARTAWLGG